MIYLVAQSRYFIPQTQKLGLTLIGLQLQVFRFHHRQGVGLPHPAHVAIARVVRPKVLAVVEADLSCFCE